MYLFPLPLLFFFQVFLGRQVRQEKLPIEIILELKLELYRNLIIILS